VGGLAAGVVALAVQLVRHRQELGRQAWRIGAWTLVAAGCGYSLSALYTGFGALRNSVLLALSVGLVSTALGLSFALLAQRSRFPIRSLMGPFSTLSMITPPFVLGLAMIYMFGRQGFITNRLLGMNTTAFYGPLGVGVAQVLAFTPLAYLVLTGVVRSLDPAMEEAAQTLRASRWRLFHTVTWPLLRPGVANAFLLCVIESLADFGNPLILGGGVPFLPTEVFFAIEGRFNQHEAAVYGVILLLMTVGVFLLQHYWLRKASYVTVTGKPTGGHPSPSTRGPRVPDGDRLCAVDTAGDHALRLGVLRQLREACGASTTPLPLSTTRRCAPAASGCSSTPLAWRPSRRCRRPWWGFLIAYVVGRLNFPGRSLLEFTSMLSFAVPGTVMGIGYVLAFHSGALRLTGTELIIILAFIFRNMPVGIRSGLAALQQIDRSLEEASTTLRASNLTTLRRILFPLLLPAVISGLMFSFVRAMTAISQVIFLVTPSTNLATVLILSWVGHGSIGRGAALSCVLIAAMAVVVLLLNVVLHRTGRDAGRAITY